MVWLSLLIYSSLAIVGWRRKIPELYWTMAGVVIWTAALCIGLNQWQFFAAVLFFGAAGLFRLTG